MASLVSGMVGIWLISGLMIIEGSPLRFYEKQFSSLMRKVPWGKPCLTPHSPFLPGILLGRRRLISGFLEGFVTTCSMWASYLTVSYSKMFICMSGCLILILEAALNSFMVWALRKYSNYKPCQSRQFCIRLYNFLGVCSLLMDWLSFKLSYLVLKEALRLEWPFFCTNHLGKHNFGSHLFASFSLPFENH